MNLGILQKHIPGYPSWNRPIYLNNVNKNPVWEEPAKDMDQVEYYRIRPEKRRHLVKRQGKTLSKQEQGRVGSMTKENFGKNGESKNSVG